MDTKRSKFWFYLCLILVLFASLEIVIGMTFRFILGIRTPLQLIYKPNYINGFQAGIKKHKAQNEFRVLCLGGSTSKQAKYPFNMQKMFQKLLPDKKVTVYSAGWPAYTSRDAYYQYRYIYNGYDLDLIVFYEAINELRANNCPLNVYKPDYSHFGFYKYLNRLADNFFWRNSYLAAVIKRLQIKLVHEYTSEYLTKHPEALRTARLIPTGKPIRAWMENGSDIKTEKAYRENVRKIIELALERKQPILLMTFCSCFPPNGQATVPYGVETDTEEGGNRVPSPMDIYGLSENIKKGIAVHNDVMRELVKRYPVFFIDQARIFPAKPGYFIDVCHFSDTGIKLFMQDIYQYFKDLKKMNELNGRTC
jgi:hypothetical protein